MISKISNAGKFSLDFLWIFTGITSLFFARDIGHEVLALGGIEGSLAELCINAGSILDIIIGIWLLSGIGLRLCYLIQIITILTFTLLLTLIAPKFWLHPFGPLTKNVPLLIMIWLFYRIESEYQHGDA
ncbi:DoxX-like family protein [Microbulbifer sp.]|uniref:DoxX-like family protein n=1 Tax=Microbulbifer sp. TaxID=1908541 RepID=UPI00258987F1|nr:DoxX-like family protein [Microbulbifer sp.]